MANEDSFIDEVTDEVRRERLFGYIRRFGWIAVVLVLILVGGAAWNEFRKASIRADAEARGDAILAALEADGVTARASGVAAVEARAIPKRFLPCSPPIRQSLMGRPSALPSTGSKRWPEIPQSPRSTATSPSSRRSFSMPMQLAPQDRIQRLEPLTIPGAPFRPLALEVIAYAHAEAGEEGEAIAILTDLLADADATEGLRQRAAQLIVALGGELDAG